MGREDEYNRRVDDDESRRTQDLRYMVKILEKTVNSLRASAEQVGIILFRSN